jgi:hypothetical protein
MRHHIWTSAEVAETVINALVLNNVKPDETFIAASGRDYGFAEAWHLGYRENAVRYGDSGETRYALIESLDNLSRWLVHDDLDGINRLIELASVYGLAPLEDCPTTLTEPCAILIEHNYYGPRTGVDALRDERGMVVEFNSTEASSSYDQAQGWIDQAEASTYVTEHNETGRPTYKIVSL